MTDSQVTDALSILRSFPGWQSSKLLAETVGLPLNHRDTLRRALSSRTDIVTSPQGVMWIGHATKGECEHFLAHLRSRAAACLKRAKEMEDVIEDLHPDTSQATLDLPLR